MTKTKLMLILLPAIALGSCSQSPQSSMKEFCSELTAGNWQKAFEVFGDADTIKTALADIEKEPETKQLAEAVFGSSKCSVAASKDSMVTLDVDAVNAQAVTAGVMADSIGMALMSAFGGESGQKLMQDAMMAKLVSGLTAENAPRTQKQVVVEMKQVDGHWMPSDGDDLLSAITGGIDKLGQ